MRIIEVTPNFIPQLGGLEEHIREVSKGLKKLGNHVEIFSTELFDRKLKKPEIKELEGITVHRFPSKFMLGYGFSASFYKALKKEKPDIIHIHYFGKFSTDAAAIIGRTNKIPTVLTAHGFFHTKRLGIMKTVNYATWGKIIGRQISAGIPLTRYDERIMHELGIKETKVIPNGVNLKKYDKIKTQKEKDQVIIIGRIERNKGQHKLIEALKGSKTKAVFVGRKYDEKYYKELKKLAKKNDVNAEFKGLVSEKEKIRLIKESKILISTSDFESFNITLLEAGACEKPVIANDVGGMSYLVNKDNGFKFRDINGLKESLDALLNNNKLRVSIGKNWRKKVEKDFTWNSVNNKINTFFNSMIK